MSENLLARLLLSDAERRSGGQPGTARRPDTPPPAKRDQGLRPFQALGMALLGTLASLRLGRALWRLLLDTGPSGAIDLKLRHEETWLWFSGGDVYALPRLTYPPGAYAIFFPFLGWSHPDTARWFWGLLCLILCLALVAIVWSATGPLTRLQRVRRALIVLAMVPVSVTIGNGQMGLAVLVALLLALWLALRGGRVHLPVAGLLAVALVKPTLSLPFLWLFVAIGAWSGLSGGLLLTFGLTFGASSVRGDSVLELFASWLHQSRLAFRDPGYANLNSLLGGFLPAWGAGLLGLLLFLAAGLWVLRHYRADPWILAGLLGVVARLWTYHRIYDDLLLVPAWIALYRAPGLCGRWGRITLLLCVISLLAPGDLRLLSSPWGRTWELCQVAVWLNLLVRLVLLSRSSSTGILPEARTGEART